MQNRVDENQEFRATRRTRIPLRGDDLNTKYPGLNIDHAKAGESHFTVQTDPATGKRYMPSRQANGRELKPIHTSADRLRQMFASNVHLRKAKEEVNPMWHNFQERCVTPIESREEMEKLLKWHGQSDDVMVVRYHQEGCTACNALDKVFEYQCHEARKFVTKLRFFDVKKETAPELTKGMVRFPQVKAFSAGQWADIEYKPPQDFREMVYARVEKEVHRAAKTGTPISALQAEEMYFSVAGPAVSQVLEESIMTFYNKSQVRLHNYWKQISQRRSWYFKKYVEPVGKSADEIAAEYGTHASDFANFGEATAPTVTSPSAAPSEVPNAVPLSGGAGMYEGPMTGI
mmetsp:Transcript_47013/g.144929  ORF Transcript_47013/g.144929 Transcript_47013/m.144929 type:complete len:345 (-) Transcript_47013:212-1246(-)